jgi:AcrR family transcriptional regulator
MPRSPKRSLVAATARGLYEAQGIHATGINLITQTANVASMTLYNNFPSKDQLTAHVVEEAGIEMLATAQAICDTQTDNAEAVRRIFKALAESAPPQQLPLPIRALVEYPDEDRTIVRTPALEHYCAMADIFTGLVGGDGVTGDLILAVLLGCQMLSYVAGSSQLSTDLWESGAELAAAQV